jgi:hypothetical protein
MAERTATLELLPRTKNEAIEAGNAAAGAARLTNRAETYRATP